MKALGNSAYSTTEPLSPFAFERRESRVDARGVDVIYREICRTGLHSWRNHSDAFPYRFVIDMASLMCRVSHS